MDWSNFVYPPAGYKPYWYKSTSDLKQEEKKVLDNVEKVEKVVETFKDLKIQDAPKKIAINRVTKERKRVVEDLPEEEDVERAPTSDEDEGEGIPDDDYEEGEEDDEPLEIIKDCLVEFEGYMKKKALAEEFDRDDWVDRVNEAANANEVGNLLFELESNTKWESCPDEWVELREEWVQKVQSVETDEELAELLVQFDLAITWDVVSSKFKKERKGWIKDLKSIYK